MSETQPYTREELDALSLEGPARLLDCIRHSPSCRYYITALKADCRCGAREAVATVQRLYATARAGIDGQDRPMTDNDVGLELRALSTVLWALDIGPETTPARLEQARERLGEVQDRLVAIADSLRDRPENPLPFEQRVMVDDFPRRNRVDHLTAAELAIQDAVDAVELVGAHVWLTDAVILLGKARDRVADYTDHTINESRTLIQRAAPNGGENV